MNSQFQAFDTLEQMYEHMATAENEAMARLHPRQRALIDMTDEPVYWVRPYDGGILIFGKAYTFAEVCEASAKYVPDRIEDASESHEDYNEALSEVAWEIRGVVEARSRGYLYGIAYSTLEPTGELGSTHVANLWPISREAFAEAEAHAWMAISADPLVAKVLPADELARRTTPTLVAELMEFFRETHNG